MRIKIKDKVGTSERSMAGLRGEIEFGRGRHLVPFIDPFGNTSYRTEFEQTEYIDHNIVVIGGYQYAFDKMFNIGLDQETTLRAGHLNDEAPMMRIGVPRAKYKSIYYNAETGVGTENSVITKAGVNIPGTHSIFGFMIGDGGCREDNITPIAPNYKNRTLFNAIPFRMSNDGYALDSGKYFGKSSTVETTGGDSITSYYVKKFDEPVPHIVHCWATDNPNQLDIVDDTVFSSTSSIAIETYVEINLSLSDADGRGYFTMNDATPRVNEFGLISGWYNSEEDDYEAMMLITKFTRPSISLAEGDSVEAVYRLYAR